MGKSGLGVLILLTCELLACRPPLAAPGSGAATADAQSPPYVSCFGSPPAFQALVDGAGLAAGQPYASLEVVHTALTPAPPSVWGDPRAVPSSQLAARLSRFLWGTEPDDDLLQKVAACPTIVREDLGVLVRQMLADDRAVPGLEAFFTWWLKLDRIAQIQPDPTLFPELTPALRLSMAEEPRRFGADVIRHGDGNLRTLFTAPHTFMDGNLAVLYDNTAVAAAAPFQRVSFAADVPRAGLLTQPGLLAMSAAADRNSPGRRAVDLLDRILCMDFPRPPDSAEHHNLTDLIPIAGRTLRQAIESTVSTSPYCSACHNLLQIGFAFERYDLLGRVRATDNGAPIDTTARLPDLVMVSGALELGAKAPELPDVGQCFARKWLGFALGRDLPESQQDRSVQAVFTEFRDRNLDIRALIAAVTKTALFLAP